MSLAILPSSPMGYGQAPVPTLRPSGPSPAKRPKLTLDTSTAPSVFGKGSTSLRLETLSATSPTVRNTFHNGYDTVQQLRAPVKKRPSLAPLSTKVPPETSRKPTPLRTELPSSAESPESTSASTTSATSVSTIDLLSTDVPYKLAYNVTSILSNSPLPKTHVRRTPFAPAKPMFPSAKKVAFKAPLTEDIKTTRFTLAHSDIESSSSTISTLELPGPEYPTKKDRVAREQQGEEDAVNSEDTKTTSHQRGEKRESSDDEAEEDSGSYPATPVAGRQKRHRQWVWTLGPVESTAERAATEDAGVGAETIPKT